MNGVTEKWLRLAVAFALGVGTTVAGTFVTFETKADHRTDVERIESMLGEIRSDVKILLSRSPTAGTATPIPRIPPPLIDGYGRPPKPEKQASP